MARQGLANTFGLPMEKVRVQAAPIGGAFGGKLMISEPLAAAAALKLRRPVRIVFSRREDFAAGNPAPGQLIELELGATADGALTAIRGRIIGDRGGLGDMGVEAISTMLSAGPYRWPAHDLTALGVSTNRVSPGAYRAPGAPPAAFAVETLMDELAQRLGRDPIDLRLQNVLVAGDKGIDGQEIAVFGARECLERVREHPLYAQPRPAPRRRGRRRRARLLARRPGARGRDLQAGLRRPADDRHRRRGHERDRERVHRDRRRGVRAARGERPRHHGRHRLRRPTAASPAARRSRTRTGARSSARPRRRNNACSTPRPRSSEIAPEDLEVADGEVRPVGAPARAISIADLAAKTYTFGGRHRPIEGYGSSAQISRAPGAAVHLSHVKVDRDTGEVRLLAHVIAQDVGKALNPALVEGQMHGGTAQGMGWALLEELSHSEDGQLQGGTFAEYALPSTDQVPPIETLLIEVPAPDGPFGAKGVGEPPVCGVPAAIANGIAAATGIRLRRVADDSGAGMGGTPERPRCLEVP